MRIRVKRGLNIPLGAKPKYRLPELIDVKKISLNLSHFGDLRFRLLVEPAQRVLIGTPLCENQAGQKFLSPASGTVAEIRRGLKRQLIDIVIHSDGKDSFVEYGKMDIASLSREQLVETFLERGLFAHIRERPFDLIANPCHIPRDIFIAALESLPYTPSAEMQVEGYEHYFQAGLSALGRLTTGSVHLIYHANSTTLAFTQAKDVIHHQATGPHPIANASVHIHHIRPIRSAIDRVWTLRTIDVIVIGRMVVEGRYHTERIIACAGAGLREDSRGFRKARAGIAIADLIDETSLADLPYLISGDPLSGARVELNDYMGFTETVFSALKSIKKREKWHFLRLGSKKYSQFRAYASGHSRDDRREYDFSAHLLGELRACIDTTCYEKVMPLAVPTMHFVRALLSGNDEMAEKLGLFEVASEDFLLPTFICPSKIEIAHIVKQQLQRIALSAL